MIAGDHHDGDTGRARRSDGFDGFGARWIGDADQPEQLEIFFRFARPDSDREHA